MAAWTKPAEITSGTTGFKLAINSPIFKPGVFSQSSPFLNFISNLIY
jgi:hypothetical protein